MQRLRSIDAHGGGMPLRLVVEGFPSPPGRTMAEKLAWARRHADHIRQALMLEPRGHADMCGAALTEPVSPGSNAGVLFMHGSDFADAFDHGIIALSTIAIERGLIVPGGDGRHLVFDTVAGPVGARVVAGHAKLETGGPRVTSVSCSAPPSFVVRGGLTVRAGGRTLPVDLAYGGACYAVVDSEAAGLGLTAQHIPAIRRMGAAILEAIGAVRFAHPVYDAIRGVHGVVFTGPASLPEAD
ncbi:MAG: proline racemase family protein, partial [Vicinamibacterales bacterium]